MITKTSYKTVITFVCYMIATSVNALDTNRLDCVINPYITVNLSSAVPGVIEEILVSRGDKVKEGQILVKLEASVEKSSVDLMTARARMSGDIKAREARYELSIKNLARIEELLEKNVVSFGEYDEAKASVLVAKSELLLAKDNQKIAELELERTKQILYRKLLRSPINGVVVEKINTAGEYVEEQPILKLAQINPLNVEVVAPLTMFNQIKLGQEASIIPEGKNRIPYRAKVVIVDSVIEAASGTFGVRLELPNPDYEIAAGLRCDVEFSENE